MCGIFGIWSEGHLDGADRSYALKASDFMKNRGPDASGQYVHPSCILMHRRLAILDLDTSANQPMYSDDERCVLVYNGELYNYLELRKNLESHGYQFRTNGDTEVVLKMLIHYREEAFSQFNGMYALAFFDKTEHTLLLARDHVGMKPLYYAEVGKKLIFGSQFDQLVKYPAFSHFPINPQGLSEFVSFGYTSWPNTITAGIRIVPPGSFLIRKIGSIQIEKHFDLLEQSNFCSSRIPTEVELYGSLQQAVKRHLISDVSVGTFLSGGIDSGLINGLVANTIGNNFTAYTVGNIGSIDDESQSASNIALALGVNHHIIDSSGVNVKSLLKQYVLAYNEPFGDFSGLPSSLVAQTAQTQGIKVLLTGDGADELFLGYSRLWPRIDAAKYMLLPLWFRKALRKFYPLSGLTAKNVYEMTYRMEQGCDDDLLRNYFPNKLPANWFEKLPYTGEYDKWLRIVLIERYYQCMALKIDRATMLHSIEARIPFMDKEFLKIALCYRAKDCLGSINEYKRPLRNMYRSMYPNIPPPIRKIGFGIPLMTWLSADLNAWALRITQLQTPFGEWIDWRPLQNELKQGKLSHSVLTWSLLYLQLWYLYYVDGKSLDELFES